MVDLFDTEVFKKLPQLDRIEYTLGLDKIKEKYSGGYCRGMINYILLLLGFFILVLITGYSAFGIDFVIRIFTNRPLIFMMKVLPIFLAILILIDIFIIVRGSLARREFNERYFKIEVKKNRI